MGFNQRGGNVDQEQLAELLKFVDDQSRNLELKIDHVAEDSSKIISQQQTLEKKLKDLRQRLSQPTDSYDFEEEL